MMNVSEESATLKITYQGISQECSFNKSCLSGFEDLKTLITSVCNDIPLDSNATVIKRKSKRSKKYVRVDTLADFKSLLRSLKVKNQLRLKIYDSSIKSISENTRTEQPEKQGTKTDHTLEALPQSGLEHMYSQYDLDFQSHSAEFKDAISKFIQKFDTAEKISMLMENNYRYEMMMKLYHNTTGYCSCAAVSATSQSEYDFQSLLKSIESQKKSEVASKTVELTCRIHISNEILTVILTNKCNALTPKGLVLRFKFISQKNESVHVNFNFNDTQLMPSDGLKVLKHNLHGLNLPSEISNIKYSVEIFYQDQAYAKGSCVDGSGFCILSNNNDGDDMPDTRGSESCISSFVDRETSDSFLEDFVDISENLITTTDDETENEQELGYTEDLDYEVLSSADELYE